LTELLLIHVHRGTFLSRHAIQATYTLWLYVCLSVCLSVPPMVYEYVNISSQNSAYDIWRFDFTDAKNLPKFELGHPQQGAKYRRRRL